jgi:hypothetical protein
MLDRKVTGSGVRPTLANIEYPARVIVEIRRGC